MKYSSIFREIIDCGLSLSFGSDYRVSFFLFFDLTDITHLCRINISQFLNTFFGILLVNDLIVVKSSVDIPVTEDLMSLLVKVKKFKNISKLFSYFLLDTITGIQIRKFNLLQDYRLYLKQ